MPNVISDAQAAALRDMLNALASDAESNRDNLQPHVDALAAAGYTVSQPRTMAASHRIGRLRRAASDLDAVLTEGKDPTGKVRWIIQGTQL